MALAVPKSALQSMMKDGSKHYGGLEEAVYRNIEACKNFSHLLRTSFGPNGMNKLVVNHLEKVFITKDAATMIKELEVQHPAAKMLVQASHMQDQEIGDGSNFVVMFAGALLEHAEQLLRAGVSATDIREGYDMACKKAIEILPTLVCQTIKDVRNPVEVLSAVRTAVNNIMIGHEDTIATLVTKACLFALPENQTSFNVDHVRTIKILGSGVNASEVMHGMVFRREVEGDVTSVNNAKVAVLTCPLDSMTTETKGTVLINTAEELKSFSTGEEDLLESQIKDFVEAGVNVIISAGKVADMALHFCNKYKIMVVRLSSKFDLRRLCIATQAVALAKVEKPSQEQLGHCDHVYVTEIGNNMVTVFKQDKQDTSMATIIVRGSSDNIMDEVERAVDDGVNCYKSLLRDPRLLPGAAATEVELATQILQYGQTVAGLQQYAIKKFAEALEVVPRTLAENAGFKANEAVSKLFAAHTSGSKNAGLNLKAEQLAVVDAQEICVWDSYLVKFWALKFATDAAVTVLGVDQIIMARPAGGPKPKENKNWDED